MSIKYNLFRFVVSYIHISRPIFIQVLSLISRPTFLRQKQNYPYQQNIILPST